MIELLVLVTIMILIGKFWRIMLPVAAIGGVIGLIVLGLFVYAVRHDMQRRGIWDNTAQKTDPKIDACIADRKKLNVPFSPAQETLDMINCVLANPEQKTDPIKACINEHKKINVPFDYVQERIDMAECYLANSPH